MDDRILQPRQKHVLGGNRANEKPAQCKKYLCSVLHVVCLPRRPASKNKPAKDSNTAEIVYPGFRDFISYLAARIAIRTFSLTFDEQKLTDHCDSVNFPDVQIRTLRDDLSRKATRCLRPEAGKVSLPTILLSSRARSAAMPSFADGSHSVNTYSRCSLIGPSAPAS